MNFATVRICHAGSLRCCTAMASGTGHPEWLTTTPIILSGRLLRQKRPTSTHRTYTHHQRHPTIDRSHDCPACEDCSWLLVSIEGNSDSLRIERCDVCSIIDSIAPRINMLQPWHCKLSKDQLSMGKNDIEQYPCTKQLNNTA